MVLVINNGVLPPWRILLKTQIRLKSRNWRDRFDALRSSCTGYCNRGDVRKYIFERDGYKCSICGATEHLEIDHIESVYKVAKHNMDWTHLNDASNLRVLCRKCNLHRNPEE